MSKNYVINNLINNLQKLQNVGYKSAKKIALQLLLEKHTLIKPLINSLQDAYDKINRCKICGNLCDSDVCEICSNPRRNKKIICVVESIADLWAIENYNIFSGVYHILDGTLSAIDGRGPEVLKLEQLKNRIRENDCSEVIIATNATEDGQTTAFYLANVLEELNIKITQPSFGLPMGSEINFLDENTLNIAFRNKKDF